MKRTLLAVCTSILLCAAAHGQSCVMDPDHYGIKGDGKTLNTAAIQHYIDDAQAGGPLCMVWFRPGTYLTGSIFLKSGVTMVLDKGVTLLGSQDIKDYPVMPTRIAGIEMSWPAALVNIYKQTNVTITGEGTIDGDGKVFWDSYWTLRKGYEPRGLRWASDYDAQRPRLLQVFDSSNVRLGNSKGGALLLRRSGFWTMHICYSHDITIDGVTIRNNEDGHGPSTDGIDIDSSNHILVQHADIAVNDDALCLKSGRDSDGMRVNRPTTDVVLRDSVVRAGAAVVTIGSETSGGFRNIEAYNLTGESHVGVGVLFKSAHTRGGWAEDIRIHDIALTDVPVVFRVTMNWNPSYSYAVIPPEIKDYPPYWKALATPVSDEKGRAHFHDVHLSNIAATGAKTVFEIDAYPEVQLDHFTLDHIAAKAKSAGHINDARDWTLSNIALSIADGSPVTGEDDNNVTGITLAKPAPKQTKADPAKKSFAEQDKN